MCCSHRGLPFKKKYSTFGNETKRYPHPAPGAQQEGASGHLVTHDQCSSATLELGEVVQNPVTTKGFGFIDLKLN